MRRKKYNPIEKEVFVCIDCESTGLDPEKDRIIEVAASKFSIHETFSEVDWLINPEIEIPEESVKIHHITTEMVRGKPLIKEILPELISFIGDSLIIGHGIEFDIKLIQSEAVRAGFDRPLKENDFIDTVRLARNYGELPSNSLEQLRLHFNIEDLGAHRALSDVQVNISVFRNLSKKFMSLREILQMLKKPVRLKYMPLGPHKGRLIKEVPLEFLKWAANKNFDADLLFTIRSEIKRRGQGGDFLQASNPFLNLE